jgi:hypothetical protein
VSGFPRARWPRVADGSTRTFACDFLTTHEQSDQGHIPAQNWRRHRRWTSSLCRCVSGSRECFSLIRDGSEPSAFALDVRFPSTVSSWAHWLNSQLTKRSEPTSRSIQSRWSCALTRWSAQNHDAPLSADVPGEQRSRSPRPSKGDGYGDTDGGPYHFFDRSSPSAAASELRTCSTRSSRSRASHGEKHRYGIAWVASIT